MRGWVLQHPSEALRLHLLFHVPWYWGKHLPVFSRAIFALVLVEVGEPGVGLQCCAWSNTKISFTQVLSMVQGRTEAGLFRATENNLHAFSVNVRPSYSDFPMTSSLHSLYILSISLLHGGQRHCST